MKLIYRPLTEVGVINIESWFDDPDTKKYLGDKKWLYRLLELVNEAPGKQFNGTTIKGRFALLVSLNGEPVALLDLETYSNQTAGMALLVGPEFRNAGIARRVHKDVWNLDQMRAINKIAGAVDPDNISSLKSLSKTNAKISKKLNKDNQFETEFIRPEPDK